MSAPPPTLDAFLPEALREWILDLTESGLRPAEHAFEAVILFADISGFTALTERLALQDPHHLETLGRLLNDFFRPALDSVRDHGGDVLKLAGDSVVACWGTTADTRDPVVARAAACALALRDIAARIDLGEREGGQRLRLRIGIAAGWVRAYLLGGEGGHWQLLVAGPPLAHVGRAEQRAQPGEVLLGGDLRLGLPPEAAVTAVEEDLWRLDHTPELPTPVAPFARRLPTARLRRGTSPPFGAALQAGPVDWLSEVRRVSALYLNLPARPESGEFPDLQRLQWVVGSLQRSIFQFGGTINKWTVDDKGVNLLALFGLPPLAHEDDPARAVLAAQALADHLRTLSITAGVAVATGRAYCGTIGSPRRHEFTAIGAVVNRAARLAFAAPPGIPWCDAPTAQAASGRLAFHALPPVGLRGFPEPVPVQVPTSESPAGTPSWEPVGHQEEMRRLQAALQDVGRGERRVLVIEGEAGIGKSTLLRDLQSAASRAGFQVALGAGEALHQPIPYRGLRSLFLQVLQIDDEAPLEQRSERLWEVLAEAGANRQLAPLLEDLVGLGMSDNQATAQLIGKVRVDNTRWLVADLVQWQAARRPLALLVEDLHWLDSASLSLVGTVAERVKPLLLVASARPRGVGTTPFAVPDVFPAPCEHLLLQPLNEDECARLIASRLQVREVGPDVADFVRQRSSGNPLHTIELASALTERGLLQRLGDRVALAGDAPLASIPVPDSLESIITARVDYFDEHVQLTAKVASIVGETFSLPILQAIHPLPGDRSRVAEHIRLLTDSHLVEPDGAGFRFRHALIHDAIYGRILRSQRKRLHAAIAQNLEMQPGARGVLAALLAHHWAESGNRTKAALYFGQAGEQSVRTGAYQEALRALDTALQIHREEEATPPRPFTVRGRWQRLRADALLGLGRLGESFQAYHEAFQTLGRVLPTPESPPAMMRDIRRRAAGAAPLPAKQPGRDELRARERTLCGEALGFLNLFAGRLLESLTAAYEAFCDSSDLGPSPEHARALATLSLSLGLLPARHLADTLGGRALELAEALGELATRARVRELVAMSRLGEGRWETCEQLLLEAISLFEQVGDVRRRIECTCLFSTYAHYRGRFAQRVELGQRVADLGRQSGDLQAQAWGRLDQLESLLNLGRLDESLALKEPLLRDIGQGIIGSDILMAQGLLASLHRRLGNRDQAAAAAEAALPLMTESPPTIVYNLEACGGVAETFLFLWREAQRQGQASSVAEENARRAIRALTRFSRVFPVGRPRALVCRSEARRLEGDAEGARLDAGEAARVAERLQMPFEHGCALRQWAATLPTSHSARTRLLEQAARQFAGLDARWDRARVLAGSAD